MKIWKISFYGAQHTELRDWEINIGTTFEEEEIAGKFLFERENIEKIKIPYINSGK